MSEALYRPAARMIVVTPDGSVLLQRFQSRDASWWVCPGGGLEEGEDAETGLRREAAEELGLTELELGPEVWRRRHLFEWRDRMIDQDERFFLVRVDRRFVPAPRLDDDSLFEEGIREQRWWTVDEIDGHTGEYFAPRRLAALLRDLIGNGPPAAPVDAGV